VEPEEIALSHGSHQFIAHGEQHQTNCPEDRHNQLIKIVEGCLSRILGTFKSQSFSKNTFNSPHPSWPSRQKKRLTPVTFLGNLCHMAGLLQLHCALNSAPKRAKPVCSLFGEEAQCPIFFVSLSQSPCYQSVNVRSTTNIV
jgi:hypothetical protein